MVEYGEKCILCFFSSVEKLHIVDDQDIYKLVKMNKIIDGIVPAVVLELVDEFF